MDLIPLTLPDIAFGLSCDMAALPLSPASVEKSTLGASRKLYTTSPALFIVARLLTSSTWTLRRNASISLFILYLYSTTILVIRTCPDPLPPTVNIAWVPEIEHAEPLATSFPVGSRITPLLFLFVYVNVALTRLWPDPTEMVKPPPRA